MSIPSDDEILASLPQNGGAPAPSEEPSAQPSNEPAPAAAPAEPQFNPTEFGYKFRDQVVYPKDRNDALELLQLGHSYRTNKDKWEKDRQSLASYEARKDEYRRYDELSQALQSNPAFRTELEQLAQKYSQPAPQNQPSQPPSGVSLPPEVEQKLSKLDQILQWKEQTEAQAADQELSRELDDLQRAEPGYDWKTDSGDGTLRQQVLKFMHDHKVYDSKIAFAALTRDIDRQKAKFDADRKAAEQAAAARRAGVVAPGSAPAPQAPPSIDHRSKSYDELEDLALQSVGRA